MIWSSGLAHALSLLGAALPQAAQTAILIRKWRGAYVVASCLEDLVDILMEAE